MTTPFPKYIVSILLGLIMAVAMSCQGQRWRLQAPAGKKTTALSWAPFTWLNDSLGNRHFERTAMMLPATIDDLPYSFQFQFDLGADITRLYGNPLNEILEKQREPARIGKLKSAFVFWDRRLAFKNLSLSFGNMKVFTPACFVMKNFGERVSAQRLRDSTPILIGTIGADLFRDKVVVIDYPNQRFTICKKLPDAFQITFIKIDFDRYGRVILPMQLGDKTYKVMFDTGASIFQLLAPADKADNFSTAPGVDTLPISSWGTLHTVIGRPLKQIFQLAGQTFSDITIYADYRPEARTKEYDAITGNALFWNKTVVIDFKNKKFGVL